MTCGTHFSPTVDVHRASSTYGGIVRCDADTAHVGRELETSITYAQYASVAGRSP